MFNQSRQSLLTTSQPHLHQTYSNPAFARTGNFRYPDLPEIGRKIFRTGKPKLNRERAIFKNGDCNIHSTQIYSKFGVRYLRDIFTSLVDIPWRYTLLIFGLTYFVSWLFFALIWWLIMFTHGDLEDEHLPQNQAEANWTPCVLNIHNFTSCYLFSIETQYTIGYGVRTTTEECPEAIFMMSMQAIIGMTIDGFILGVVFAKMTRPKLRNRTILFSKNAVVCQRDDELCLMFRVGDMRKNSLIGAAVRAQVIKPKRFKDGEFIRNYRTELEVSVDGGDGGVFFLWPVIVVHKINEDSPFYEMSATDMLREKFEILVALDAGVESTGQSIQARTSYVPNEILWGYKFEPLVDQLKHNHAYDINYSKFNSIYPVETPLCSAAELASFNRAQEIPEPPKLPEPTPGPSSSFDDDDDDDEDEDEILPRPPPPQPKNRSMSRRTGSYQRYDSYDGQDILLPITQSYV